MVLLKCFGFVRRLLKKKKSSQITKPTPVDFLVLSDGDKNKSARIGDEYHVGVRLGVGAFATVRRAERKSDGFVCAVKIIAKSRVVAMHGEELLRREIDILRGLKCEHVTGLLDVFEDTVNVYLVMPLADGGELFARIVQRGNFSEVDAANVTRQLLTAVAHLHSHGIVHRDLKPENILFAQKDKDDILLADFGLSKHIEPDSFNNTFCGTPGYVAREVLLRQPYGAPADMWSVGVIVFVMLGGYLPFEGYDTATLHASIVKCNWRFDPEYWSQVSGDAKDFIARCLLVHPSGRPTAVAALAHPWLTTTASTDLASARLRLRSNFKNAAFKVMALSAFSSTHEFNSTLLNTLDTRLADVPESESCSLEKL